LPPHLLIVGGSYVGLEFAQMYRRFGSEVTIVEMAERLIAREDAEVSAAVKEILEAEGITIRLKAECVALRRDGDRIAMNVDCEQEPKEVTGTHVLLATGRRPNTDDLGCERAGIALDKRGYIVVDEELRTSVDGVWALGDVNGRGAFTHTAYNDYEIVAANLFDGESRRVSDRIPTYALFIDPPLGRAGGPNTEARASGKKLLLRRCRCRASGVATSAASGGLHEGSCRCRDEAHPRRRAARHRGRRGDPFAARRDVRGRALTLIERAMYIHPTVTELLPTLFGRLQPLP
jgi:pyruvate/2-oxoglutarate dehydrogenase complex dihydrolipoamide dehydrogenase (E3) component